jgi:hypothetical protein
LVQFGFVKDYSVWKFHSEADASASASGGNSSMLTAAMTTEHDGGQQPSSSSSATVDGHGVASDNVDHDYITMEYLL